MTSSDSSELQVRPSGTQPHPPHSEESAQPRTASPARAQGSSPAPLCALWLTSDLFGACSFLCGWRSLLTS